jgi:uncharacterized protein (DUF362 family)/Pyruvate/2-oxoacid:ferredoxin oxidoreductase delta subunit
MREMPSNFEDSQVSIIHCKDYSHSKSAISRSLELIGRLESIVSSGDRVLLKVNLLAPRPPEDAVTTHPAVVAVVIDIVKEAGGIPIVGDSAGMIHPGATAEALEISGIQAIAAEKGAEIANFDTTGFEKVDVKNGKKLSSIYMAKPVLEADVVISLPKLKTHELTLFTGAVKNMFGTVPSKIRKDAHTLGTNELFSQAVVDIYSVRPPDLAIMDGVVGMEGHGPSRGEPVDVGVIMAARNCVALDMVASKIMGFGPDEILTSKEAAKRGFGPSSLEDITLLGDSIEEVLMDCKRPGRGLSSLPNPIGKLMLKLHSMRPEIDNDKCQKCGACIKNCPTDAIQLPYPIEINKELCILCFTCFELCPHNSIFIQRSWLARHLRP